MAKQPKEKAPGVLKKLKAALAPKPAAKPEVQWSGDHDPDKFPDDVHVSDLPTQEEAAPVAATPAPPPRQHISGMDLKNAQRQERRETRRKERGY